ncbi:ankyrin repeat-containing domain protein [Xylaria telfairii]|nr:ankyrin repeat-containing domain protein [Xylaria telfairii]
MASDDWEYHKDTITCLYLLEKLSLQDLSHRMKERYSFDKKKHQYEYQLKQWGMKKNIQRDDWRYISHRVQKRKKAGKQSMVTVLGMPLPPEKVHKEVKRYTTIPTARDFGIDAPSPPNPTPDIVRVVTPSLPEFKTQWPANLPWLKFIQDFDLNSLQMPGLPDLFAMLRGVSSMEVVSRNPLTFCNKIIDLVRSIPQNCEKDDRDESASLWTGGPWAIASASLKAILFSLANKSFHLTPPFADWGLEGCDRFILWLLESISSGDDLLWPARFFGTRSPTTDAISEAIYGCAIRQRKHDLITQLFQVGVDPNIPIKRPPNFFPGKPLHFKRGKMALSMAVNFFQTIGALELAFQSHDIHLATILLEGGINIYTCKPSPLNVIAYALADEHALHFVQLLLKHNPELDLLPPLGIAIAKGCNLLAAFLIDRLHHSANSGRLISYNFDVRSGPNEDDLYYWYAECFQLLKIDCTLLHIAIVSENNTMANMLLRATLDARGKVSKKALQSLFMVASLAGDRETIEHLIGLDVSWDGDWTLDFSPLVASAWNPDIEVTEMILQSGAFSDHDIDGFTETSKNPLPIHVATRSGNTNLVQWIISNGMFLDVQFKPAQDRGRSIWHWLVPSRLATPFQLALESGNLATVLQCRHARLIGGELIQAIKLGDDGIIAGILSRGVDIGFVDPYGDSVLEAAIETQNHNIIALYFSHGGKYRSSALLTAVKTALVSQDNSTVLLLATHRPVKMIDRYESSALVIAVRQKCFALITALLGAKFLPGSIYSFYNIFAFQHGVFPRDYGFVHPPSLPLTPLRAAFVQGDMEIIEKFLKAGYIARPRDLKPVGVYEEISRQVTNRLLLYFPPSNKDPQWTRHLLFRCIHFDDAQRVRECIACIDSLEFYIDSSTPLQKAVESGNMSLVALLINSGADVDAPAAPVWGASALQLAAILGHLTIARLLLEHGANVNAPPAKWKGRSALEGASEHGNLDMVQLLLENGVTLDGSMRIHYIRAVAYARHQGNLALGRLLRSFGGWTDRDQELSDREAILRDDGYFSFDGESQDWQFRRVIQGWRGRNTHQNSEGAREVASSVDSVNSLDTTCRTDDGDFPNPARFDHKGLDDAEDYTRRYQPG